MMVQKNISLVILTSMETGIKILKLRNAAGWTQADLAEKAGISQPAVSTIESGKRAKNHIETIAAIARALGVSIDGLLEKTPPGVTPAGDGVRESLSAYSASEKTPGAHMMSDNDILQAITDLLPKAPSEFRQALSGLIGVTRRLYGPEPQRETASGAH